MHAVFRTTVRLGRDAPQTAYAMHQALAAATAGDRVLWAQPAAAVLVVQATEFDPAHIPGALTAATHPVPDLAHMPPNSPVEFTLIGNPIRSVGKHRPDGSPAARPGRHPLPAGERPGWLIRRFRGVLAVDMDALQSQQLPPARGRGITIARHLFAGTGTLTDPAAAAHLVQTGVGAGKGFGCGLLTIRGAAR